MKSFMKLFFYLSIVALISLISCGESSGPDDIDGNTDLPVVERGTIFNVDINLEHPLINELSGEIKIVASKNGKVDFTATYSGDFNAFYDMAKDYIPGGLNAKIFDSYQERFPLKLDTLNRTKAKAFVDFSMNVTEAGIQTIINTPYYGHGEPFTLVKFSDNVGTTYTFVNDEGILIERKIVEKSQTADWPTIYGMLEVVKVEEKFKEDLIVEKSICVLNQEYGVVGLIVYLLTGEEVEINFYATDGLIVQPIIESVEPAVASPGDIITIKGSRFGDNNYKYIENRQYENCHGVFVAYDDDGSLTIDDGWNICQDPEVFITWTDTMIQFKLPELDDEYIKSNTKIHIGVSRHVKPYNDPWVIFNDVLSYYKMDIKQNAITYKKE